MKKIFLCLGLVGVLFGADSNVKFEITPTFNWGVYEGHLDLDDRGAPGLKLGYHFGDSFLDQVEFGFEHYSGIPYNNVSDKTDLTKIYLSAIKGVDLGQRFYLYGLVGAGYDNFNNPGMDSSKDVKDSGFGHYGAGLKYKIADSVALRLETRDQIGFNDAQHQWISTLGISFGFGGEKEQVIPVAIKKTEKAEILAPNTKKLNCPFAPREGALLDENGCEKTIHLEGHFEFAKADIGPLFADRIEEIAKTLNDNEKYKVVLEGHTDNSGPKEYNYTLSERRAQSVAKELEKFGVEKSRIQIKAYGPDRPRSSNATKEGRIDNRRVEAKFFLP